MLNGISWYSYWITMSLLLAGYYLVIYLLYFRSDFSLRIHNRQKRGHGERNYFLHNFQKEESAGQNGQPTLFDTDSETDFQAPQEGTEERLVYSCIDELNAFFQEACSIKWNRDDMVQSLQTILRKYPSLKTSAYKESLSNVIVTQCEQLCSVHLNGEQVVRVWQHE